MQMPDSPYMGQESPAQRIDSKHADRSGIMTVLWRFSYNAVRVDRDTSGAVVCTLRIPLRPVTKISQ